MLFWLVPVENDILKIVYYSIIFFILATAFMCYIVPYNALIAEISPHYDERTRLSTYR